MDFNNKLELYRDLSLSKNELFEGLPEKPFSFKIDQPVIIYNSNLIKLLNKFREGKISIEELVDWVNIIWFSEWYEYFEDHSDCISSIMNELEELDEGNNYLTIDLIDKYIKALQSNLELE